MKIESFEIIKSVDKSCDSIITHINIKAIVVGFDENLVDMYKNIFDMENNQPTHQSGGRGEHDPPNLKKKKIIYKNKCASNNTDHRQKEINFLTNMEIEQFYINKYKLKK